MGFESTYALTEDGRVYAWGRNNRGQLGIESGASTTPTSTPAPVMVESASGLVPLTGVESIIRSDGSDQCVKMRDPSAFGTSFMCWGGDDWGEVGAGTEVGARTGASVPDSGASRCRRRPTALVRGEDHACGAVPVGGSHRNLVLRPPRRPRQRNRASPQRGRSEPVGGHAGGMEAGEFRSSSRSAGE